MSERQIIYPTERLLANPRIFQAVANYFNGPDWETLSDAFYDLLESEFLEDLEVEPEFNAAEVCFRESPDEEDVFQVVLSTGIAAEIRAQGNEFSAELRTEDDLGAVSAIYHRLIRAIEESRPELSGDIVLSEPPTPGNGYLRDAAGNAFRGKFHLLTNPEQEFDFVVEIVDLQADILKATIL